MKYLFLSEIIHKSKIIRLKHPVQIVNFHQNWTVTIHPRPSHFFLKSYDGLTHYISNARLPCIFCNIMTAIQLNMLPVEVFPEYILIHQHWIKQYLDAVRQKWLSNIVPNLAHLPYLPISTSIIGPQCTDKFMLQKPLKLGVAVSHSISIIK